MKLILFRAGLGFFLLITSTALYGQQFAVKNTLFSQRTDGVVIVTYDLLGDPSKKCHVTLSLITPDSGKKLLLNSENFSGDIGRNIRPGKNKKISWDFFKDFPEGLSGEGFQFEVVASLQRGMGKWPWIAGGGVAAGVVVYLLIKWPPEKDLPAPPKLPTFP